MTNNDNYFVIADLHGHWPRLQALLAQEGFMSADNKRLRKDVTIIQLGDLGHFGLDRSPDAVGRPTVKNKYDDFLAYKMADDGLIDVVLWGNHDRSVFDPTNVFSGYAEPNPETYHLMKTMHAEGKIRLAYNADGILLTHAGLHKQFEHQNFEEHNKEYLTDLDKFVSDINEFDQAYLSFGDKDIRDFGSRGRHFTAITNAVSRQRGGISQYGGILWRDASESLYDEWPQVFGHTARDNRIRYYGKDSGLKNEHVCLDIGNADNGRLAGIYLPSREIARI